MIKINTDKTVAFTGHRILADNEGVKKRLVTAVEQAINDGYDTFLTGMAKGFDLIAGKTVLDFKSKYPDLKLIACVPYKGQKRSLEDEEGALYRSILENSDDVVFVSEKYAPDCYLLRDRYMVDNCSFVIACCQRSFTGTSYTVSYALSKGIKVNNTEK